ncbi:hypothetical protein [Lactobacillus sp. HT06-2]|uniref:hypothetical protein n=1 Tax=Lactobacillus sp. HT06-2 TaxID=2080222 RepID=UPI000CD90BE0|nr:hypothetical protein [Lactobacillus sp. HT06-2]
MLHIKKLTYLEKSNDGVGLDLYGKFLNVIPVNIGLVAGTYRFLSMCKKDDWEKYIKNELKKAKNGKAVNVGLLNTKLFYVSKDIVAKKGSVGESVPVAELTGNDLVYPFDNSVFETIEPKGLGKIRNFPLYENTRGAS